MKLKKVLLICVGIIAFIAIISVVIYFIYCLSILGSVGKTSEEFIGISESPNGNTVLEIYRKNAGPTTDSSVKVYIKKSNKLIYNSYHKSEADVV